MTLTGTWQLRTIAIDFIENITLRLTLEKIIFVDFYLKQKPKSSRGIPSWKIKNIVIITVYHFSRP